MYAELAQYGVVVTGGRVSGVGVAGFTLGGGEFLFCLVFVFIILFFLFRIQLVDKPSRIDC